MGNKELIGRVVESVKGRDIEKQVEQLFALLGGGVEKEAAEKGVEELSPAEVERKVHEERKRKLELRPQWDRAFKEKLAPYIYDKDNLDAEVASFSNYLFGILRKRIGEKNANDFMDDAVGFITENMDHYIKGIHSGEKKNREPSFKFFNKKGDPNFDSLKSGFRFTGQVMKRKMEPGRYEVKFSGPGLTDMTYAVDGSGSNLHMREGEKYKMEVTTGEGTEKYVKVEGGGRGFEHHPMILSSQVKQLIDNGADSFIKTEYKHLIGEESRILQEIKDLTKRTEALQDKLEELLDEPPDPDTDGKIERLTKKIELNIANIKKIEDLGELGLQEVESDTLEERERKILKDYKPKFETQETMEHRETDPYHLFHNIAYTPTGKFERKEKEYQSLMVHQGVPQEAMDKIKKDLFHAADSKGEFRGVAWRDWMRMMWDAITSVPDPLKKGWIKKFLESVKERAEVGKIRELQLEDRQLRNVINEVIKGVEEMLLSDPRFSKLKENLGRVIKRRLLKETQGREAGIPKVPMDPTLEEAWGKLVEFWHKPYVDGLRDVYTKVLLKDLNPKDFKAYVWDPTEDGLERLIERDLGSGFDVLRKMSVIFTPASRYSDFLARMRFLFLNELVALGVGVSGDALHKAMKDKIHFFKSYMDDYPERLDSHANIMKRMYINKQISKYVNEDLIGARPKQEVKERGKREKVEVPTEKIYDVRDKKEMDELDAILGL